MGDWNVRQHWFRADDPDVALAIYQRLEAIGRQMDRDEREIGATGLRFGFVSPTLVIATTTQKWGYEDAFADEVVTGLAGVVHIEDRGDEGQWSRGFADFAPAVGFAWCRDGELREQLAAQLPPLRFGKAVVYQLPDGAARTLIDGGLASPWSNAPPCVGTVVVGLTSPHGLLALGTWCREAADCEPVLGTDCQAMRLVACRLAGESAWALVSGFDQEPCLPDAGLHSALARHGPRALWRSPGVRRSWGPAVARRPLRAPGLCGIAVGGPGAPAADPAAAVGAARYLQARRPAQRRARPPHPRAAGRHLLRSQLARIKSRPR